MAQLKDLIVNGPSRFIGTMYGKLVVPLNDTASTASGATASTKQTRNIIISTSSPSGGENGDVWIKYTP